MEGCKFAWILAVFATAIAIEHGAVMGFDIPEPFAWDKSFSVFDDKLDKEHQGLFKELDKEHKGLFKGILAVEKNPGDGKSLEHLSQVVRTHFVNEEAMMLKINYADRVSHKETHDAFLEELGSLTCPLNDDQVNFAKSWLVNHIKGTDMKYVGK